jgi:hypothetical protein
VWTSIYIANNKMQAEQMQTALKAEGIMTNVRIVGGTVVQDESMFEIQVLESEVEEAQSVVFGTTEKI